MFQSRNQRQLSDREADVKRGFRHADLGMPNKAEEVAAATEGDGIDTPILRPYAKSSSASTSSTSFQYVQTLPYQPPQSVSSASEPRSPPQSSDPQTQTPVHPLRGLDDKRRGLGALKDRLRSKSSVNLRAEFVRTVSGGTRPLPKRTLSTKPPHCYTDGSPLSPTFSSQTFLLPADPFSTFYPETTDQPPLVIPIAPTDVDAKVSPTTLESQTSLPSALTTNFPPPPPVLTDHPVNLISEISPTQRQGRSRRGTLVSNKISPAVLPASVIRVLAKDLVTPAFAPPAKESFFATIKRQHSIKDFFNLVQQHASSTKQPTTGDVNPKDDSFVVDISAPPVPTLPPHLPHLLHSQSVSAPPTSGSFFDLYAELGIDPPQQEDLEKTYARSSGRNSRTSTRISQVRDSRRSKDPDAVKKGPPAPSVLSRNGTGRSQYYLDVSLLPSSPPSLPLPVPVAIPLLHILPWSETAFDAGSAFSGTTDSDMGILGLSSFDVGEFVSSYDGMLRGQEMDAEESHRPKDGESARGAAAPVASDSNATITQARTRTCSHPSRTGGRNRQRSTGDGSRSPSSPRGHPFRTSSPASQSVETSEAESSDSSNEDTGSTPTSRTSDDIPLAQRLPQAIQMQKALRQRQREEKKARRAERSAGARRAPRLDGRENSNWKGEGGVPAKQLSKLLEEAAAKQASRSREIHPSEIVSHQSDKDFDRNASVTRHGTLNNLQASGRSTSARRHPNPSDTLEQRASATVSRHTSVKQSGQSPLIHSLQQSPALKILPVGRYPSQSSQHRSRETSDSLERNRKPQRSMTSEHSTARTDTEWLASTAHHHPRVADEAVHSISASSSNSRRPSIAALAVKEISTAGSSSPKINSPLSRGFAGSPVTDSLPNVQSSAVRKPTAEIGPPAAAPQRVEQQRILIGFLQGPCEVVDVTPQTTAEDVVQILETRDYVKSDRSSGMDWVLYEMFGELGCDRPVRMFETIQSVTRGWNRETRMNTFLLKRSSNIRLVNPNLIPRVAPMTGAYVQWENRKGKWSKRWLETRNGLVFLAKSDKGKDEIFLCHASAFDVYTFSRTYKAPKPFVFALKSHDSPVLFENQADYLHIFSCEMTSGSLLYEALFIATSNCLSQSGPQSQAQLTRLVAESDVGRRRPTGKQPLVDAKHHSIFAGGSLLSRLGK